MNTLPEGEKRTFQRVSGEMIDGAPVTYVITLAAVAAAMSYIPLSVVISSGKGFPLSQAIYPLIGWLLGPLGGMLAAGTGALIGVFIAPHTTTIPVATVLGAMVGSFSAGAMAGKDKRWWWWLLPAVLLAACYVFLFWKAVIANQIDAAYFFAGTFIDWSAWLLFVLPTRRLAVRWIQSSQPRWIAMGIFIGVWMIAGLAHLASTAIIYPVFNYPGAVWLQVAVFAPLEHILRCSVGTAVGTGLIIGMRSIGLLKPVHAAY